MYIPTSNAIPVLIERHGITEKAIAARVAESRTTITGTDEQLYDAAVRFLSNKAEELARYGGKVTWK